VPRNQTVQPAENPHDAEIFLMKIGRILPPEMAALQEEIEGYARGYGLDFFPQIFEVLDYDQINQVAAYGGFRIRYPH